MERLFSVAGRCHWVCLLPLSSIVFLSNIVPISPIVDLPGLRSLTLKGFMSSWTLRTHSLTSCPFCGVSTRNSTTRRPCPARPDAARLLLTRPSRRPWLYLSSSTLLGRVVNCPSHIQGHTQPSIKPEQPMPRADASISAGTIRHISRCYFYIEVTHNT